MIQEQYVSFETAKLLKEKGFNETCRWVYNLNDQRLIPADFHTNTNFIFNTYLNEYFPNLISAPTQSVAMRWLRDIHKLHITAPLTYGSPRIYEAKIMRTDVCEDVVLCPEKDFDKPEEACEAAIKYCIEYLI